MHFCQTTRPITKFGTLTMIFEILLRVGAEILKFFPQVGQAASKPIQSA